MPRCNPETKQRILDEMALTTARNLEAEIRLRFFDGAKLLKEAGYPRIARRFLAECVSFTRKDQPPFVLDPDPWILARMRIQRMDLPRRPRDDHFFANPVPSRGGPPSSAAIALLVPGSSRHSIAIDTLPRRKPNDAQ